MVGPELSLITRTTTVRVPGTRASGHRRGDLLAIAILVALPVIVFGIPAVLGHAVLPGDDLTQNFPLRVLAGRQIRGGQLPLFDPYIWGGAPLLASWNAAAAYSANVLAAMQDTAGRAYGLDAVTAWPRLYPVLGEQCRTLVDDRRDTLDASVRLAATMAVTALASLVLLLGAGWWTALALLPSAWPRSPTTPPSRPHSPTPKPSMSPSTCTAPTCSPPCG